MDGGVNLGQEELDVVSSRTVERDGGDKKTSQWVG